MSRTAPLTMLAVKDGRIIDGRGQPVRLRGVCIGGWMNMENFINGFPGAEHGVRAAMAQELGPERAQWFFDRWLDHFLTEDDLAFIRSCGATVVRLPLNYRHFESDAQPFRYLEAGFERLGRALDWCDRHGLYAILDLHAAQGWQSPDWHCDNGARVALFWQHPHFQDRFVALWEEFARRHKGRAVVAGYNVMNEPVSGAARGRYRDPYAPDWGSLNRIYRRVVEAIRRIDADHLIFLEGDCFSTKFDGLEPPFADHLVYSTHNYTGAGFGPGRYPGVCGGEPWDRAKQTSALQAHEGTRFAARHRVPLWVGEFGSVYNGPAEELGDRLQAVTDQLEAFTEADVHWTMWTYKDLGAMGWVGVRPDSPYAEAIRPVLQLKRALGTDFWMYWMPSTTAKQMVESLGTLVHETVGDPDVVAGDHQTFFRQATLDTFVGQLIQPAFAKCFRGKSDAELDQLLASFNLSQCAVRRDLVDATTRALRAAPRPSVSVS